MNHVLVNRKDVHHLLRWLLFQYNNYFDWVLQVVVLVEELLEEPHELQIRECGAAQYHVSGSLVEGDLGTEVGFLREQVLDFGDGHTEQGEGEDEEDRNHDSAGNGTRRNLSVPHRGHGYDDEVEGHVKNKSWFSILILVCNTKSKVVFKALI